MKSLRAAFLAGAILLLGFVPGARAQEFGFVCDAPAGSLSAATTATCTRSTAGSADTRGYSAIIFLDITTLTLPDADDEVDFYIQTTYDGGTSWTDVENVHFATADDGTTATRIIVIDGAKDGPGRIQSITGTDPAAGSEISEAVPAATIWRPAGLTVRFDTDATVATRIPVFIVDDGATIFFQTAPNSGRPASATTFFTLFDPGYQTASSGAYQIVPFSVGQALLSGFRIRTSTSSIQAGDNYGAPQLHVEAWHDPRVSTDATMGDNLKSYDRPLGSQIRIKTAVTGASAPTYAFSARGVFR